MSVIQFNGALFQLKNALQEQGYVHLTVPQERPRCGGEVILIDVRMYICRS